MAEESSLKGEQCQGLGCGLLWPVGTLTSIEIKQPTGHTKKVRVCPQCLATFVDRMNKVTQKVCGMCANFAPTGPSMEGEPMGMCGIFKRTMLADDPECKHFAPIQSEG